MMLIELEKESNHVWIIFAVMDSQSSQINGIDEG